ncbi:MAG: NAD(P)-dependent oxidoreductase [Bacteroidia bacterium]
MIEKLNVFLTGGSGFIGKFLIDELVKRNYFVFVLSRKENSAKNESVNYVRGDIQTIEKHIELLKKCSFFIHAAGEKRDETNMQSTNVDALGKILLSIKQIPSIKFIQISSSGIYGIEHHPDTIITEDSAILPNNTYERTKYEAEKLIISALSDKKFLILRPSNIFGEGDEGFKLLNLMKAVKTGKFFFVNKNAKVNYLYAGTFARDTVTLMEQNFLNSEIFNMNGSMKITRFIEIILSAMSLQKPPALLPKFLRPFLYLACKIGDFLPKKYQFVNSGKYRELTTEKYYSVEKLKSAIHTQPELDLEQGIRNIVLFYSNRKLL